MTSFFLLLLSLKLGELHASLRLSWTCLFPFLRLRRYLSHLLIERGVKAQALAESNLLPRFSLFDQLAFLFKQKDISTRFFYYARNKCLLEKYGYFLSSSNQLSVRRIDCFFLSPSSALNLLALSI